MSSSRTRMRDAGDELEGIDAMKSRTSDTGAQIKPCVGAMFRGRRLSRTRQQWQACRLARRPQEVVLSKMSRKAKLAGRLMLAALAVLFLPRGQGTLRALFLQVVIHRYCFVTKKRDAQLCTHLVWLVQEHAVFWKNTRRLHFKKCEDRNHFT